MEIVIRPASGRADIGAVRMLFDEYAQELAVDLSFQGFAAERDGLPGEYVPPRGRLLLAEVDGRAAGCVALRPLDGATAEMKRLYLRPAARGAGLGRRLAHALIAEAEGAGYERLRLDTLPSMGAAIAMYRALGFQEIPAYRHNPVPGALFLEMTLRPRPGWAMKIPVVHVDAFTSQVFRGNPAAVCPLESWLDDQTLQSIAAENNLSETAFLVGGNGKYEIRWMTPVTEVDLCGHATLASAFVLFGEAEKARDEVVFRSKSGELKVRRQGDLLTLDFPSRPPQPMTASEDLLEGLGHPPREVWAARDYMAVFETEDEVRTLAPDFGRLAQVDRFAVIVTARGDRVDFVSRFFAPGQGLPEDPVTGSAHCTLVPFWSKRLGKKSLHALQVSARGGELFCEDQGERVAISGRAVRYLTGTIEI